MHRLLCQFAVVNVALGVLYAFSAGPYMESQGEVISARNLVSSGGEDGFIIAAALLTFLISAAASIFGRAKPRTLLAVYAVNHVLYGFLLLLAQSDTSLVESVRLGDWPLLLGLIVPVALFAIYASVYATACGRRSETIPSIERTDTGKPVSAPHVKRQSRP